MNKKIVTFGEILLRLSKSGYQRLGQGHVMDANFGGSEAMSLYRWLVLATMWSMLLVCQTMLWVMRH